MQRFPAQRTISRSILTILCLWLLMAAATCERKDWTSFMGDEATYLMQAESLAWDQDLLYGADDFHRFVEGWKLPPQGLILQSGDGGRTITYGKPFFYAAYLSPFLRLFGHRGPFLANALLLILCAAVASRVLERFLGPWASSWVAALIFASVTFASTFWIHADLFLMCISGLAFAYLFDLRWRCREGLDKGTVWRQALIGGLLAVVMFSRPPYLPVIFVALWLLPRHRWRGAATMLLSAALLVVATSAVHYQLSGTWTPYGALRSGFYAHTGFPAVDFPVESWTTSLEDLGNSAARTPLQALRDHALRPSLMAWNGFYFLFGRHVGILIYFLPVLLILRPTRRRLTDTASGINGSLLVAVLISVGFFLWSRPFNFYGGGGSLANRYFLPLFPLLWFVPRRRFTAAEILVVSGLAGLFLFPLWQAPRQFPITKQGTYRYVAPLAQRWLPFETSQSNLRLAGREDLYQGFYLRLTSPQTKLGRDGFFRLPTGSHGKMLLGSTLPLKELDLETQSPPSLTLHVGGADLGPPEPIADGLWRYRLRLHRPGARHPMWWTWQKAHLYRLDIRFGRADETLAVFRLTLPKNNTKPDAPAQNSTTNETAARMKLPAEPSPVP